MSSTPKSRQPDPVETARGIARSQKAATPVIRIPLAGVPSHCPHCGIAAAFPLTVYGNAVSASCPACYRIVAPVAVTTLDAARHNHDGGSKR